MSKNLLLCIILFISFQAFARYDFDSLSTFKFGLKGSYRIGQYNNANDIFTRAIFVPSIVFFKRNGNYIELEPINFVFNNSINGNYNDSVNYSREFQGNFVPKISFLYKVYTKRNNRIFIGMTHAFRYASKTTSTHTDMTKSREFDYAFGINLNFQKALSKRFILDFSLNTYLLKLGVSNTNSLYSSTNNSKWASSINSFYENDYSSLISTPVSITIGLTYCFVKSVR